MNKFRGYNKSKPIFPLWIKKKKKKPSITTVSVQETFLPPLLVGKELNVSYLYYANVMYS